MHRTEIAAFLNQKGGVGKTTSVVNVGSGLTILGNKVLIVDLDPQGSLTDVMYVREEMEYEPLVPVFEELDKKMGKHWEEIIVDVGTADMPAMEKAMQIAGRILIPVAPSQADVWSTQRFMDLVRKNCKDDAIVTGIINRADTHPKVTETEEAMEALSMIPGLKMQKSYLYQRTVYRRAFSEGLAVFEMMPANKAAAEVWRLARSLFREKPAGSKKKKKSQAKKK